MIGQLPCFHQAIIINMGGHSLYLNPFSPRPAKNGHFVILHCDLTPDDITRQGRVSGWERVKYNLDILLCFTGQPYKGLKFKKGNCGVSIMRSGKNFQLNIYH